MRIEFLKVALLHDDAVAQDDNAVGVFDRAETVGDRDDGEAIAEAIKRLLNEPLALVVEGGGGFIEDKDRRVAQDGACDGDPLALTAGKRGAALTDEGLVARGHF